MPSPRLAARYAKSLMKLAIEKDQVDVITDDVRYLRAVCLASRPFVNLLKSPVIKADKKKSALEAVTGSNVSKAMLLFEQLLVVKGRESVLPEILDAFIKQYNELKGIHEVKLTTTIVVDDKIREVITHKVASLFEGDSIELKTHIDPNLIGGFRLEFENKLVDASVITELVRLRKQFANN